MMIAIANNNLLTRERLYASACIETRPVDEPVPTALNLPLLPVPDVDVRLAVLPAPAKSDNDV